MMHHDRMLTFLPAIDEFIQHSGDKEVTALFPTLFQQYHQVDCGVIYAAASLVIARETTLNVQVIIPPE
jgi:hypothetical protein